MATSVVGRSARGRRHRRRRDSGTTRPGSGPGPATVGGSSATASGASTISGSISRYSKIRSNSASEPWISTWTLSSWPSGKNSRLCSVVKATMSPIVGASGRPDRQVAGQPVHERRRDREDRADDHEEPAADHRLADLEAGQPRVDGCGTARSTSGLLAERLRQQHAADTLSVSSVTADISASASWVSVADLAADLADAERQVDEERQQAERQQRQAPVDEEHRDDRADRRSRGCS